MGQSSEPQEASGGPSETLNPTHEERNVLLSEGRFLELDCPVKDQRNQGRDRPNAVYDHRCDSED
jgi:hypothetical protein